MCTSTFKRFSIGVQTIRYPFGATFNSVTLPDPLLNTTALQQTYQDTTLCTSTQSWVIINFCEDGSIWPMSYSYANPSGCSLIAIPSQYIRHSIELQSECFNNAHAPSFVSQRRKERRCSLAHIGNLVILKVIRYQLLP